MDRLKAILADRILDLTSSSSEDVKVKIDKIQRFRDFANACQTLMTKYPQIEEELIKMVNDGDFDTKIASSRVDSVIRMADRSINSEQEEFITSKDENEFPDFPAQTEDIDFEIVDSIDNESEEGYANFEEVKDKPIVEEVIVETETELSDEELASVKRKKTIRMVLQIAGVLIAVALLIVIIKFVMNNWQTILIVLGVALLVLILVWFLKRKRK